MTKAFTVTFVLALMLAGAGNAGAVPQTVDFSDWPGSPTSFGWVDVDTVGANTWFYDNYGLEFSNVYMYWDDRDPFDNIGIASDISSMADYNGGTGYFYFADTTDYVTIDWTTISSEDIYLDVYDAANNVLDSFFAAGSGTLAGTTTLTAPGISAMSFHDGGGQVGISTLSYDYDGVTDGRNDDVDSPIPEPATVALLGLGIACISYQKRRRLTA